jgi:hypothetical protein
MSVTYSSGFSAILPLDDPEVFDDEQDVTLAAGGAHQLRHPRAARPKHP